MIITAHIALASAVSSSARFSLPGAFLFGLISHHLLDFIPHLDAGIFWPVEDRKAGIMPVRVRISIYLDFLLSLGFLIWWGLGLKASWPILFWASFGAVLPDFIVTAFPFWIPRLRTSSFLKRYEKFHCVFFQETGAFQENWILGIFSTILIIGVSLWLFLK